MYFNYMSFIQLQLNYTVSNKINEYIFFNFGSCFYGHLHIRTWKQNILPLQKINR